MVFAQSLTPRKWTINGSCIEQVKQLKYLSWAAHRWAIIQAAQNMQKAILCFSLTKRGKFIPAVIQVFKLKILPQLLYGIPTWILGFHISIEFFQFF